MYAYIYIYTHVESPYQPSGPKPCTLNPKSYHTLEFDFPASTKTILATKLRLGDVLGVPPYWRGYKWAYGGSYRRYIVCREMFRTGEES